VEIRIPRKFDGKIQVFGENNSIYFNPLGTEPVKEVMLSLLSRI
jgi:hypothetical protein